MYKILYYSAQMVNINVVFRDFMAEYSDDEFSQCSSSMYILTGKEIFEN